MTSDPSTPSPTPASPLLSRAAAMTIGALIAALLIAVSLQSRWQHATAAANLELATLQIAALETALESETTLSSASAETMVDRRHGQNISARALLHGSASSSPDSPVAVVIWSDSTQSGQIVFLADTAVAASFSSMSGYVSNSASNTSVPLGFTATRSPQVVSLQATDHMAAAQIISIQILPREGQGASMQWIGEFQR
ncbi:hypothetical protein N9K67_03805 [Opitutaceae bacterium]|nr:hypothetical protein [Opitutaceae bacterium]